MGCYLGMEDSVFVCVFVWALVLGNAVGVIVP